MEKGEFKFEVVSTVPPYIFKEAQEIVQKLHEADATFDPQVLLLTHDANKYYDKFSYLFIIYMKPNFISRASWKQQMEYIEKATSSTHYTFGLVGLFYEIGIYIRTYKLIRDLEQRILDLNFNGYNLCILNKKNAKGLRDAYQRKGTI